MNLPDYLKSLGYIEIPFSVTRVNHIVIHAKANGEDVVMIVDTGASRTCIAESCAERLGLTSATVEPVAASLALPKKTKAWSKLESLDIGSLHMTDFETWIVDFSYINMLVEMKGEELCDGVLGTDILTRRSAVIDYKCRKLYLKGPSEDGNESGHSPSLLEVLNELKQREPIFHRPELGTTRADFESMMEDTFSEVGASGRSYSRQYVLDELEKRYATQTKDDWQTRDFHCVEIVAGNYLLTYTLIQGARVTRRSTIWRRTPDGWKILYHQGTEVQDLEPRMRSNK